MLLSLEEESIMVGRFAGSFLKREDFALLREVAIFFERFADCFLRLERMFSFSGVFVIMAVLYLFQLERFRATLAFG